MLAAACLMLMRLTHNVILNKQLHRENTSPCSCVCVFTSRCWAVAAPELELSRAVLVALLERPEPTTWAQDYGK